jgi:hypothetical protein
LRVLWPALAIAAATVLLASCGDEETADDITRKAFEAINEPGMVYHAQGDDGSEVWLDVPNQLFRARDAPSRGGLTSVGDGWTRFAYDPFENRVVEEDMRPTGNIPPRIDHPATSWFEPLGALAFGQELRLIGRTTSGGRAVIALEARTPIFQEGVFTGASLVGRVELDPQTYLIVAFERKQEAATGEIITGTPTLDGTTGSGVTRIRYEVSELVPRESLPEGFFSRQIVEDAVLTLEDNLRTMRDVGITPYWLGEQYRSERGLLVLGEVVDSVIVDPVQKEATFRYGLALGTGDGSATVIPESVIIRLAPRGEGEFGQPNVPSFAGTLPETRSEIEVRGTTGTLYVSVLTPAELPCPQGNCPETDAPIYRRVTFAIDDTAVQIETFSRIDALAQERNRFNSLEGILELANALTAAE